MKLAVVLFATIALASCSKDDDGIPMSNLSITTTLTAEEAKDMDKSNFAVEATNTASGKVYTTTTNANGEASLTVEEGIYSISISATRNIPYKGEVSIRGISENQAVKGSNVTLEVKLSISKASTGWVFKELYFTGSKTPSGSTYYKDKYFELYNNSDQILYADGISLCETKHLTVFAPNDWASYLDKGVPVQAIYTIPGNGMQHPVQPGKSIILADVGIDHTQANANSFNLSVADFEWYDNHSLDVDVPEVENLIRSYCYTKTIWTPHGRGYCSYLIFRQDEDMATFLNKNKITFTNPNGSEGTTYLIPNEYILDAVELSTPSDFASKALSATLDAGWTHCGDADDARFGKCVRRKVASRDGGRVVYQDTNNSTNDFEATVTPMPKVY